jgi:4-amino-4-deoxychorismate lyase
MSGQVHVVVTLDGAVHDCGQPVLYADDLAAVRGDGVFETLLLRDGRACLVEPHLRRLVASAAMMDLPAPELPQWRAAIAAAEAQWAAQSADEGALRLVYSRGRESGSDRPTAYLTVTARDALSSRRYASGADNFVVRIAGIGGWALQGRLTDFVTSTPVYVDSLGGLSSSARAASGTLAATSGLANRKPAARATAASGVACQSGSPFQVGCQSLPAAARATSASQTAACVDTEPQTDEEPSVSGFVPADL